MLTSLGVDKAWIRSGLLFVLWITFLVVRCYHLLAVISFTGSHKYIILNISLAILKCSTYVLLTEQNGVVS